MRRFASRCTSRCTSRFASRCTSRCASRCAAAALFVFVGAILSSVFLTLAPTQAAARAYEPCAAGEDSAHCVVVLIDHLRRLGFPDEVRTVLVGNPAIADVTMISATEAVISAKAVGATNMIFLNGEGLAISDFEVLVRESEAQRIVLRRGPALTELYQCAPRCARTLTQLDSPAPHQSLAATIGRENGLSAGAAAAGAQADISGAAPITQADVSGAQQQ